MIYARQIAPEYQNSDFELEAYTTGEQQIYQLHKRRF